MLGLCDELTVSGWLERSTTAARRALPARPSARRHRLCERAGILVGVDAGRSGFTAVAADLRGTVLASARRDLAGRRADRALRVRTVQELVAEVLAPMHLDGPPLLTVIGIPAPVDEHGVSPVGVSDFWHLMNADFPEHLEGRVSVENDANSPRSPSTPSTAARTWRPSWWGEDRRGLVVDGRLLHGARGGAGEMRFLDAVLQDDAGAEGVGALARRWALEALERGRTRPRSPTSTPLG